MALANQEAQRYNHDYIDTEHVLLGLVKEGSGVGAGTLRSLGKNLWDIRLEVEKHMKNGPDTVTLGKLPQTPAAKNVITWAIAESKNLNHNYVGTEHLLLGLLTEQAAAAYEVLRSEGLTLDKTREQVLVILGTSNSNEQTETNPTPDQIMGQFPFASLEHLGNGFNLKTCSITGGTKYKHWQLEVAPYLAEPEIMRL